MMLKRMKALSGTLVHGALNDTSNGCCSDIHLVAEDQ